MESTSGRPDMILLGRNSGGGIDLELELERRDLLPGRLVPGILRATFRDARDIRGAYVTLRGTEHWQVTETRTDAQGHSQTRTVTRAEELPPVPVRLSGPASFAAGETRDFRFDLPAPALGPPTVTATVVGVEWELDAKLDVPGFDPGVVAPVRVLQPTALLRAGVVPVGQFALWPAADAEIAEGRATVALDPVPLCLGEPFAGTLAIHAGSPMQLQEIRLELRVKARATVSSGKDEEITLWTGRVAGPGRFGAEPRVIEFSGTLPPVDLPTARLPHGETQAQLHVILAQAFALDPHLVRDVAICSTTEI